MFKKLIILNILLFITAIPVVSEENIGNEIKPEEYPQAEELKAILQRISRTSF